MMITRSTPREVGDRTCKRKQRRPFPVVVLLLFVCEWNGAAQPAWLVGRPVGDCETAEVGSRHRHREREKEIKRERETDREKEISVSLLSASCLAPYAHPRPLCLFINHARVLVGPGAMSDPHILD